MKGDFFHILNRGVEKRKIFMNQENYLRFLYDIQTLNNKNLALPHRDRPKNLKIGGKIEIVDVILWCLIENHFHILVQEKIDKGVSLFSKKLTSGYTQCFNLENKRNGVLFQGKSKIIPVKDEPHFQYIPYYILANPIKIIEPNWKEQGIKNFKEVIDFLENYKYSSFSDLIGKNNFPEITNKKLFYETYDTNEKKIKKDFIEWLKGFDLNTQSIG